MAFSIGFTQARADYDPDAALGELRLGKSIEIFDSDLGAWAMEDYEQSWMAGLQRVIDGAAVSCLIVSMPDAEKAMWVDTYALYRVGNDVYVHNINIVRDDPDIDFDPAAPWESIHPRVTEYEDGFKPDEWCVSVNDIRDFLESTNSPSH